jgi:molybdopterin-biosynthesis enzyme MoeA-like protein
VLNGKTRDSNSNYLARFLFELGIDLKRIEVIADDEEEVRLLAAAVSDWKLVQIVEAARRMVKNYDFVVTSGGIGAHICCP